MCMKDIQIALHIYKKGGEGVFLGLRGVLRAELVTVLAGWASWLRR